MIQPPNTKTTHNHDTAYLERWAKAAGKFKEKQQASGGATGASKVGG